MTLDDGSHQLTRELSNLRAAVRENGMLLEQMRDELRAVHKAVGGIEQHLADMPERDEFEELRRKVKAMMPAVRDVGGQVTDHETRLSAQEAA